MLVEKGGDCLKYRFDPVQAASRLFYVNAVIWIALAAWTLARALGPSTDRLTSGLVIAALMVGNAAMLFAADVGIGRRNSLMLAFGLSVVCLNIALTFTDQVGLVDCPGCSGVALQVAYNRSL